MFDIFCVGVHVGGKFTKDPLFNYLGGHVLKGCWTDCYKLTYEDIENRLKDLGNENAAPHVDDSSDEEFHLSNEIEESSEDESLVEEIETNDEDYMIAMQNRKALRASHRGKVQLDRNLATSEHVSDYKDSEDDGLSERYNGDHSCSKSLCNRLANAKWVAKEFMERFRRNPDYGIDDMMIDLQEKYRLSVSKWVCYRARTRALKLIRGILKAHYAKLGSYMAELKSFDREGRFELLTDAIGPRGQLVFKRFYVGFSSLRKGYLEGCRPCICLDGCSLKTEVSGALLSAVGRDGNNQMFPISWCVVEGETEHS
ncbi:hypothetical protein GH714_023482 [Hevea brasiliensis]|uniref:Transposase MuDR plant domain-containing protein n=1 Tax=Hevea brasiliensis TaxID=3981 RepID=A0A6A6LAF8_HEVBR|nr:hypothetical protein GH714_023482 [Hevea brasiliensis]